MTNRKSIRSDTVRLGLMAPLSGLVQLYGEEISWAGKIACDEVNAAGGILGRPLELIITDDGSIPETAVPAALELINKEHCVAMIGNLLSNSRIAVANQVSAPHKVPLLNFSFYEGSIYTPYFFSFSALPNQQISNMIPYMAQHAGPKMFFAGSNYEWPRGSIDAAKSALKRIHGEVVGEVYIDMGCTEFSHLLDLVKKSGADVFVPYFAGSDQLALLTQLTESGLKDKVTVVMGHYDEAMVSNLPPAVREGFYSVNSYFMSVNTPQNSNYLKQLKEQDGVHGVWPNGNGLLTNFGEGTYLCVKAFALAANKAKSIIAEDLIASLKTINVAGPQGEVVMDPLTNHASVNCHLVQCNANGTFKTIKSFGQIPPEVPMRYRHLFPDSHKIAQPGNLDNTIDSEIGPPNSSTHSESDILSAADTAILSVSCDGIIVQANESASEMFGYQSVELVGMNVEHLIPPRFRKHHVQNVLSFSASERSKKKFDKRGEIFGYRKDGSEFPIKASLSKLNAKDEEFIVVTLIDITEQKKVEIDLAWKATHDQLTKLPNRALIIDRLSNSLLRSERTGKGSALLFIDLDYFKLINDSHGHEAGDKVLIFVAELLLKSVRPGDIVARFGGDEFLILCDKVESIAVIRSMVTHILREMNEPIFIDGANVYATASIGVSFGQGTLTTANEMLRDADTAMYRAKEKGRNQWQLFDKNIRDDSCRKLDISNWLRNAIANEEFEPRFQPIVETSTRRIIGAELLLRWFPRGGEVSPVEFIPISELTGEIINIGNWVFNQACLTQVKWKNQFGEENLPYISVNVSARQLSDKNLLMTFRDTLSRTGASPKGITLEITETALMDDVQANLEVLAKLGEMGMKLAIDDFGTGYSSLSHLVKLPVDALKVDKSFIDHIDAEERSLNVASAVISMAQALNLHVIAEGVETESQFNILKTLQCDKIQGYLFFKPLEIDEFEAAYNRQVTPLLKEAIHA